MLKSTQNAAGLLVLAVFFVLDRILKLYFLYFGLSDFGFGIISFRLAINQGISFGLPLPQLLIFGGYLVSFAILIFLASLYWRRGILSGWFLCGLIIIGAASNFLDRLDGGVIDYIDIKWFSILNLSDVYIVCGTMFLAIIYSIDKDLVKR